VTELTIGFIGGVVTLPAFLHDFDLTNAPKSYVTDFSSNVVSVFQAGAVFGALLSSPLANSVGRRWSIIINLIIYTIGAAFMTGAQGSAGVALMYTGRVFTGWAVGASSMITPVYVAECAPAHIRGRLVGLYEVGVQFGTMVSRPLMKLTTDWILGSLRRASKSEGHHSMASTRRAATHPGGLVYCRHVVLEGIAPVYCQEARRGKRWVR
jgi:MFS family permease